MSFSPVNMATVAGQPVTMSCGMESSYGLIQWKVQPFGSHEPKLLFNGYNISKDRPKLFVRVLEAGGMNLANNDPRLEDAGTYHCIQTIENQGSYRKKIGISQLTVFCKSKSLIFYIFVITYSK